MRKTIELADQRSRGRRLVLASAAASGASGFVLFGAVGSPANAASPAPAGPANAVAAATQLGLPASVIPAVAQLQGAGSAAQPTVSQSVQLSNYSEVQSLLADPGSLTAAQLAFLETVPTEASTTATVENGTLNASGVLQPAITGHSAGCGNGKGTWNCVYTQTGSCSDPIIGTTETTFSTYEGMSGNYKKVTNVSHPNTAENEQYGWTQGTPGELYGFANNNTEGWMTAGEKFGFLDYAYSQNYNYNLDVYQDSSYTASESIQC